MLYTWNNTDIPPKPNKNDINNKVKLGNALYKLEVKFNPFVISITPVIKHFEIFLGIPNAYKVVLIISNIPEVSRIDKITEKNTIKPPIERREKIDFFIAFPKISPKSDIFMGASFELNFVSLKFISNLFGY